MISFVIPFRPKHASDNWAYHSQLLNRTLQSACNQDHPDFSVIVVYSDMPEIVFEHDKITWLHFPFPFLPASAMGDYESYARQYYNERRAAGEMDQARRTIYGSRYAINKQTNYIMSLDDDDMVSDKIAGFVAANQHSNVAGWFVNKGYVYTEEAGRLYRYPKNLQQFSGSTHIVRADLVDIPDPDSKNLLDFNFFSSHAWLRTRLKDYKNAVLEPLPFYGIIYVLHGSSWTSHAKVFIGKGWKKWAKIILYGQQLNKQIIHTFNFKKIDARNG